MNVNAKLALSGRLEIRCEYHVVCDDRQIRSGRREPLTRTVTRRERLSTRQPTPRARTITALRPQPIGRPTPGKATCRALLTHADGAQYQSAVVAEANT